MKAVQDRSGRVWKVVTINYAYGTIVIESGDDRRVIRDSEIGSIGQYRVFVED